MNNYCFRNQGELVEGRLEVFNYLGDDYAGDGEIGGILEAFVLQQAACAAGWIMYLRDTRGGADRTPIASVAP